MSEEKSPQVQAMEAARAAIDAIDDQILDLLGQRVQFNNTLLAAKGGAQGGLPLRPGREAEILRRLIGKAPEGVDADLILDVWRALIGANVRRQKAIDVIVGGGSDMVRQFDVARRHFGGSTKIVKAVDAREALTRALEAAAAVAVLPWPGGTGLGAWWPILAESRFHKLQIIAALPLRGEPEAAAIAAGVTLTASGADKTFGLAFDPHHRAQRALNESHIAGREAGRVRETVLIEMDGFVSPEDGRIAAAIREGLEGFRVIGCYARI